MDVSLKEEKYGREVIKFNCNSAAISKNLFNSIKIFFSLIKISSLLSELFNIWHLI